jgi:hypothetical protein
MNEIMFLDEIITHEIGHMNQNNYWRKLDGRSYCIHGLTFSTWMQEAIWMKIEMHERIIFNMKLMTWKIRLYELN